MQDGIKMKGTTKKDALLEILPPRTSKFSFLTSTLDVYQMTDKIEMTYWPEMIPIFVDNGRRRSSGWVGIIGNDIFEAKRFLNRFHPIIMFSLAENCSLL